MGNMGIIEDVLEKAEPVLSFIDTIKSHHESYCTQLKEAQETVARLTGAVISVGNLIAKYEMDEASKKNIPEENTCNNAVMDSLDNPDFDTVASNLEPIPKE